jgi:exodeoxyribonuclease VII large subunit
MAERLESLSPLAVLSRGYSVTQRTSDGRLLTDANSASTGELITTRLARGVLTSRIEAIEVDETNKPKR